MWPIFFVVQLGWPYASENLGVWGKAPGTVTASQTPLFELD